MPRLLVIVATALAAAALLVALTGGIQTSIGPLTISATSASRLLFEAAVLLLIAECLQGLTRSGRVFGAIVLFLLAGAADASPTRVGDGFEYLGMARNLARAMPPALSEDDFRMLRAETDARGDPSWDTGPMPLLRGTDGRYDFPHFWMCSLVAAPFVALATRTGTHPAEGFTLMNLALMGAVCWLLVRSGASLVTVLFAAMMLWWIDKAHAEVFIAALTAAALLLRGSAPAASLLLLGMATAQMPPLAVLLGVCVIDSLVREGATRPVVAGAIGSAAIAALHPLYYLWRLGVMSPLSSTVAPHVPGMRALITPLVDLNLGVFWFATALCVLVVTGAAILLRRRDWRSLLIPLAGGAALLFAAAQTPNVNHGGTPGMSRYGVWLIAMLLPLAVEANRALHVTTHASRGTGRRVRARRIVVIAATLTVLFAAVVLHPRVADAGITPRPTRLAAFVWTRAPALDNPLPEVFVERLTHVDGQPPVPVATAQCEKALIAGTGTDARWPKECSPMPVPQDCARAGALCYANGSAIAGAPQ